MKGAQDQAWGHPQHSKVRRRLTRPGMEETGEFPVTGAKGGLQEEEPASPRVPETLEREAECPAVLATRLLVTSARPEFGGDRFQIPMAGHAGSFTP